MRKIIYKEFTLPISIEDMKQFYTIEEKKIPRSRPYVWYMFVMSADGVGSLKEENYHDKGIGLSGPGLALKQFRDTRPEARGAYADWRLLQYGWAIADAVASGSGVLKAEPNLTWMPVDPDLSEYRTALAKELPLRVLITGNGFSAKEMSYPVFRPEGFRTLVATSERGYERMQNEMASVKEEPTAEFKTFGSDRVDFAEMLRILRKEYNVKLLDLQGGPDIAGQFFEQGLVDEYRLTASPAIAGSINSEGKQRPGPVKTGFGPESIVTMELVGLGVSGSHTFHRYEVRHHK